MALWLIGCGVAEMGDQPHDVDVTPVAWREAGAGPVVLFLHGLGGSRTAWEPQLAELSDCCRCVAWDMPGYGASNAPSGPLTFEMLAEAAVGLLDRLNSERAVIVGLSLGGMVGLHLAINHPDRVAGLVLLDSSPAFGFDGLTDSDDWIAQRLAPLDAGETPAKIAPEILRSVAGEGASETVIEEAAMAMARIPTKGLAAAVRCLTTHNVVKDLDRITTPTLVIVGDQDTETPPTYSRFLAENIANADYVEIPGIGHLSNLEAPNEVNRLLRGFVPLATLPVE